jgi:hypothetical protein
MGAPGSEVVRCYAEPLGLDPGIAAASQGDKVRLSHRNDWHIPVEHGNGRLRGDDVHGRGPEGLLWREGTVAFGLLFFLPLFEHVV